MALSIFDNLEEANDELEKIEDEIDLDLYHVAMKQHIKNPQVLSFDEMMKELDF